MGNAASNDTKQVLQDNSYVFSSMRYNGFVAAKGTMCYGQYLLTPAQTTGYQSWPGTINQIFIGGCSNICNEVQEQRLHRVALQPSFFRRLQGQHLLYQEHTLWHTRRQRHLSSSKLYHVASLKPQLS